MKSAKKKRGKKYYPCLYSIKCQYFFGQVERKRDQIIIHSTQRSMRYFMPLVYSPGKERKKTRVSADPSVGHKKIKKMGTSMGCRVLIFRFIS